MSPRHTGGAAGAQFDRWSGPIPTIPYAAIAAFLGKPSLISRDQARHAPHVAALRDRHVAVGAPHEVYVDGLQN